MSYKKVDLPNHISFWKAVSVLALSFRCLSKSASQVKICSKLELARNFPILNYENRVWRLNGCWHHKKSYIYICMYDALSSLQQPQEVCHVSQIRNR